MPKFNTSVQKNKGALREFDVRQGKQGDQSYKNVRHIRHLYRILTFGVSKQAFLDFLDFWTYGVLTFNLGAG